MRVIGDDGIKLPWGTTVSWRGNSSRLVIGYLVLDFGLSDSDRVSRRSTKMATATTPPLKKQKLDESAVIVIGVLALQGAYREHCNALKRLGGCEVREVREPRDLEGLDGIILPGGRVHYVGEAVTDERTSRGDEEMDPTG